MSASVIVLVIESGKSTSVSAHADWDSANQSLMEYVRDSSGEPCPDIDSAFQYFNDHPYEWNVMEECTITEPNTEPLDHITVFLCPECESEQIQHSAWVDTNRNEIVDGEGPTDRYYCPDCDDTFKRPATHHKRVEAA